MKISIKNKKLILQLARLALQELSNNKNTNAMPGTICCNTCAYSRFGQSGRLVFWTVDGECQLQDFGRLPINISVTGKYSHNALLRTVKRALSRNGLAVDETQHSGMLFVTGLR